jgi:hypothetical protein
MGSIRGLVTIAALRQGLVPDIQSDGSKDQELQSSVSAKQPDNQIHPRAIHQSCLKLLTPKRDHSSKETPKSGDLNAKTRFYQ